MRIVLNFFQILIFVVAFGVLVSYIIRRYELGNRGSTMEGADGQVSVVEGALGIAGEIVATVLSAVLYPVGYLRGEASLARLKTGERPVILCHGYMHNRSAFFLLRYRLSKAGWRNVVSPNFRPATASIPDFAQQLADTVAVALIKSGCDEVDLVGHSMGGLVVRYYIQNLGGASCVRTAITLGSPHRGTKMAALGLFGTAEQFRSDSPVVLGLDEAGTPVSMTAIWSDFDNIVLPPENARLPEPHRSIMIRGLGHIALLFSDRVFEHVRRELSEVPAA